MGRDLQRQVGVNGPLAVSGTGPGEAERLFDAHRVSLRRGGGSSPCAYTFSRQSSTWSSSFSTRTG